MTMRNLLIFLVIVQQCYSANILAIFPFPGLSHFVMFGPLIKELADRGHNVDLIGHFQRVTSIERLTEISIKGSLPIVTNNMSVVSLHSSVYESMRLCIDKGGTETCGPILALPEMQNLKNTDKKYDLLITEQFGTDCMLGWGWYFDIPTVVMTSSVLLPWATDRFGIPDNPSYVNNYFVEYHGKMSLWERIMNTWIYVQVKFVYWWFSSRPSNQMAKEFFGPDMPNLEELALNTSLLLVNSHFSINTARPWTPNAIEVAGLHIGTPNPVNQPLNKTLTTNLKGIIYFSLGSVVKTETLPITKIQALLDAFRELPYKVVWRAIKDDLPKGLSIPENIHFESWFPQLDLLCDPRVKLFVSHGGMMGSQEAIYCGVPILGIPLFADQYLNIKHAESGGYAVLVKYEDVTKQSILNAAKRLLYDNTYLANVKAVSEEFKDRPLSAMNTSIYWIDYVLRHKGAPKLRSSARLLTWYEYFLIDVIAVVLGLPMLVLLLIMRLCRRKSIIETRKIKKK